MFIHCLLFWDKTILYHMEYDYPLHYCTLELEILVGFFSPILSEMSNFIPILSELFPLDGAGDQTYIVLNLSSYK